MTEEQKPKRKRRLRKPTKKETAIASAATLVALGVASQTALPSQVIFPIAQSLIEALLGLF
jgi:hypothetical protein